MSLYLHNPKRYDTEQLKRIQHISLCRSEFQCTDNCMLGAKSTTDYTVTNYNFGVVDIFPKNMR